MLYYIGTVILKMAPKAFWRSTPKKINILSQVHSECNSSDDGQKVANSVDDIPFLI